MRLVLLALPPRATQGERSCWGSAPGPVVLLSTVSLPRQDRFHCAWVHPFQVYHMTSFPGQGGCAAVILFASAVASLFACVTSVPRPGEMLL